MCGRYTVRNPQAVAKAMGLSWPEGEPLFTDRYNIAPTQTAPVVRMAPLDPLGSAAPRGRDVELVKQLAMLRWGLIPSWAKDISIGNRMINARGETVHEKPAFKRLLERRRCLVPATGFYEWQKPTTTKGAKQPFLLSMRDDSVFAFGGLWDRWTDPSGGEGDVLDTYTILTTEPNTVARQVHDRMPVIIAPGCYDRWLDPKLPVDDARAMIQPYDPAAMQAKPVSTLVNNPANDRVECIEPLV